MHFTTENEPDELIFDVFAFDKQKYKQIVGRNIVLVDRKLITFKRLTGSNEWICVSLAEGGENDLTIIWLSGFHS